MSTMNISLPDMLKSFVDEQALTRYPYLFFCVENDDHVDVWRVLHGQRDIAAWMHQPDAS